jgi:hypothetical protein
MLTESKARVDLLVLNDVLEAVTIRSVLESFGIEVRCHFIGNVKKLVSLLSGEEPLHKIVIISCHGVEEGMILPELSEELEKEMPYHKILRTSNCAEFLNLQNKIIINTGCYLGKGNFAQSFLQKGASSYIGFEGAEEGDTVIFFVISLLYFYICKSLSLQNAFAKANSLETTLAKLYLGKNDEHE